MFGERLPPTSVEIRINDGPPQDLETYEANQRRLFQVGVERYELAKQQRALTRRYRQLQRRAGWCSVQAIAAFVLMCGHAVMILHGGPEWFGAAFGWMVLYALAERQRCDAMRNWQHAIDRLPEATLLKPLPPGSEYADG